MSYDLSMFRPGTPFAGQQLFGPGDTGQVVSGPAKLVQWVVNEFMTPAGSIPLSPNGCGFVSTLLRGIRTEADVFVAWAMAAPTVLKNIQAVALAADPTDEQLAGLGVGQLQLTAGVCQLTITVANRAGTTSNGVLPLSFVLNR